MFSAMIRKLSVRLPRWLTFLLFLVVVTYLMYGRLSRRKFHKARGLVLATPIPGQHHGDVIGDGDLVSRIRVLCLIQTSTTQLYNLVRVINSTWARRCHSHFFVLRTRRRSNLWQNTYFHEHQSNMFFNITHAIRHVYDNRITDFDWLLKADDNMYVIMSNLKLLLSNYNSTEPLYLNLKSKSVFEPVPSSGGGGDVISNRGIRRVIEINKSTSTDRHNEYSKAITDGTGIDSVLDNKGIIDLCTVKSDTMNSFNVHPVPGVETLYIFSWSRNSNMTVPGSSGPKSVIFYNVNAEQMILIDHLLYRTSIYGG